MKVAILIPTKNRPDFLKRAVAYYNSLNSPHPIYIGDASNPEISTQNANNLKRFGNVEVKHFHWENLNSTATSERLAVEAKKVLGYCALHGDDDYFVPSSLTSCAKFLSKNKGYRTAQGRAAVFLLNSPGAYGKIKVLGEYWGENYFEDETSSERIKSFMKKYFVAQLSVHRADEYLEDCEFFRSIKDLTLGEIMHCLTFAIRGKSKFIDCLYMIRSVHADRLSSPNSFVDWIMRPSWSSDLEKCIKGLSITLSESSKMPLDQSGEFITKVLEEYLDRASLGVFHPLKKVSLSARLKNLLPMSVKNVLRPLNTLIMNDCDMRLLRSKKSRFYEDFLPVSNSLKEVSL